MDLLKALAISIFLLCTSSVVRASTKQQQVPVQQQLEPFAVVTTAITQRQQEVRNGRYNINKDIKKSTTVTSKEQQLQAQQSMSASTSPKEQTAPRRQRKGRLLDRSFQWEDFDLFGLLPLNGLDHRS